VAVEMCRQDQSRLGGVYSMDASLQWMCEGSDVCRNVHV